MIRLVRCIIFVCVCVYVCLLYTKSLQFCPPLCNPKDSSPPGSSVHGILQVRTLEWVAIPFSRGSSWPRDRTQVSCIAGRYVDSPRKKNLCTNCVSGAITCMVFPPETIRLALIYFSFVQTASRDTGKHELV